MGPHIQMKEQVRSKAIQRWLETGKGDKKIATTNGVAELAMSKLAYYPCSRCDKVYFGGEVACGEHQREDQHNFDPKDLVRNELQLK
jgi:hypothetical protein